MMVLATALLLSSACSGAEPISLEEAHSRMADITCTRLSECFSVDFNECAGSAMRHFSRGSDWPNVAPDEGQMAGCEAYVESLSCDPQESSELWWSPECTF